VGGRGEIAIPALHGGRGRVERMLYRRVRDSTLSQRIEKRGTRGRTRGGRHLYKRARGFLLRKLLFGRAEREETIQPCRTAGGDDGVELTTQGKRGRKRRSQATHSLKKSRLHRMVPKLIEGKEVFSGIILKTEIEKRWKKRKTQLSLSEGMKKNRLRGDLH